MMRRVSSPVLRGVGYGDVSFLPGGGKGTAMSPPYPTFDRESKARRDPPSKVERNGLCAFVEVL